MAIGFPDSIELLTKQPNFTRDLFKTLEEMKNFDELSLPDVFIASCVETGQAYVFNRKNEKDPDLGKWRPLAGADGGKTKAEITAAYSVGGVKEGETIEGGTEFEAIFKKMLEGKKDASVISYYGVSAEKVTNLTGLTKVEAVPNFSFTIDASNEYVIIACPNTIDKVSIFSNGFDYTTSFTKFVSSTYTFYYSEVKVTCTNFTYTVSYN